VRADELATSFANFIASLTTAMTNVPREGGVLNPPIASWDDQTLERIVNEKRKNSKLYQYIMYECCMYHIVGAKAWNLHIKTGRMKVTDLEQATCYVEAYGLLLLENNWKKWRSKAKAKARARTGDNETNSTGDNATNTTEDNATDEALTKYTTPNKGRHSWSQDGIKRFNELVDEVTDDRESEAGKEFDAAFKKAMEESAAKKGNKRQKILEGNTVSAANGLMAFVLQNDPTTPLQQAHV